MRAWKWSGTALVAVVMLLCASAMAHTYNWIENGEQLEVGDKAPEFSIVAPSEDEGEEDVKISLSELNGKANLMLAFCFDPTGGSTKLQLGHYLESWKSFEEAETGILAITFSSQDKAHETASEMDLPFPIHSDPEGDLVNLYRVSYRLEDNGDKVAKRAVFIVDKQGVLQYVDYNYNNKGGMEKLMKAIKGSAPNDECNVEEAEDQEAPAREENEDAENE